MSWADSAACRGAPTDMFFPDDGRIRPDVKAICDSCPVALDCLVEAFRVPGDNDFGIRGGMTAKKRRVLRTRVTSIGIPAIQQVPTRRTKRTPPLPSVAVPLRWNPTTERYERI